MGLYYFYILMTGNVVYPYTVHKLKLNSGNSIAYVDEGAGDKVIVFVHGLATYAMSWKKNIEGLKGRYRCIAMDLPGNGLSDRGDFNYSISFFADAVYQLIAKLDLKHVCLCGHSMGGQIVMKTILDHPECAENLVLCAPAGFETFTPVEKDLYRRGLQFFDMFSTEENSLRQAVYNSFYHTPSQGDEMLTQLLGLMSSYPVKQYRKMMDGCIDGMLNEPVFSRLHEIKQPVLAMFGERDGLIPNKILHPVSTKKIAEAACAELPDATLYMISQCGHFLQWERADVTNQHIKDFLS